MLRIMSKSKSYVLLWEKDTEFYARKIIIVEQVLHEDSLVN
jgi:hypothetical protein